jgi:hypothetical protein
LNLDKSINDLSKRIDKFDSFNDDSNELRYWKGKKIIPLNEWKKVANCDDAFSFGIEGHLQTNEALQYFPDDYSRSLFPLGVQEEFEEKVKEWYSDYEELMERKRNPNYGRTKCFHCLLSPDGDDPIFIGINMLVAKALQKNEDQNQTNSTEYPCSVVNRFDCPYDCEKGKVSNTKFDVDLFELANMAFTVEIALAVARKDSSVVQIKNKQDLYQVLTNREMFVVLLEQGLDYVSSDKEMFEDKSCFEILKKGNRDKIVDYFMNVKDKVKLEELRLY